MNKFKVISAPEFINSGPRFGSHAEKLAIAAEERFKSDRQRLSAMATVDIEQEKYEFERCEYFFKIAGQLADKQDEINKEGLPKWLQ